MLCVQLLMSVRGDGAQQRMLDVLRRRRCLLIEFRSCGPTRLDYDVTRSLYHIQWRGHNCCLVCVLPYGPLAHTHMLQ